MNKEQLKQKYGEEKVYVLAKHIFDDLQNGFTPVSYVHDICGIPKCLPNILYNTEAVGHFMYRYEAEGNEDYIQLIPYLLVKEKGKDAYFATKRIGGEPRLLNKLSLGIGGHIEECDLKEDITPDNMTQRLVVNALKRETEEEVDMITNMRYRLMGYLKNSNSSTCDHVGVAYVIEASECTVKEKDSLEGEFLSVQEILNSELELEDWGEYLLNHITKPDIID